jgi:hypothetical protein
MMVFVVCLASAMLGSCLAVVVGACLIMSSKTNDSETRARLAREQEEWTSRPEFWTE